MKKGWLVIAICFIMFFTVPVFAEEYSISGSSSSDYQLLKLAYLIACVVICVVGKKDDLGPGPDNEANQTVIKNIGYKRKLRSAAEISYDELLSKYIPNYSEERLLNEFYNIFKIVLESYMEYDYKKIEENCSFELFNIYKTDIDAMKKNNKKNIVSDFQFNDANIRNIELIDNRLVVDAYLCASHKEYLIDTKTGKVLNGNSEAVNRLKYDLEFVLDLDKENYSICPNCGAKLTSRECEFCHTIVSNKKDHFVLNKKGLMK